MPNVVTITRPDVIALIEKAAKKLACGNKTEAVALAMRRLLDEDAREGSLLALIAGLSGSATASNRSRRPSMSSRMLLRVEKSSGDGQAASRYPHRALAGQRR